MVGEPVAAGIDKCRVKFGTPGRRFVERRIASLTNRPNQPLLVPARMPKSACRLFSPEAMTLDRFDVIRNLRGAKKKGLASRPRDFLQGSLAMPQGARCIPALLCWCCKFRAGSGLYIDSVRGKILLIQYIRADRLGAGNACALRENIYRE